MNTVPTITPNSITGMTGLTKRPVYFLRLNGAAQPNLVVKGENSKDSNMLPFATNDEATTSIKWGSKLMKNVNNSSVNSKIMTPNEVIVFKRAAMASFPNNSEQYANVAPGGMAYNWVKMPYVAGLSDAEFWEDGKSDMSAIKKNIAMFSDDQVWTDLGKIVAVDIFNGNQDRFDHSTGQWINQGNVMFVTGGQTKVIGLDTFDPFAEQSNLVRVGGYEQLLKLNDPARRRNFAIACVKSVGTQLKNGLKNVNHVALIANGPHGPQQVRINVATMQDLFLPYAPTFEAGLAAGAMNLKLYLQNKVRQYRGQWQRATPTTQPPRLGMARAAAQAPARKTIPQGILDRMAYLGWMV